MSRFFLVGLVVALCPGLAFGQDVVESVGTNQETTTVAQTTSCDNCNSCNNCNSCKSCLAVPRLQIETCNNRSEDFPTTTASVFADEWFTGCGGGTPDWLDLDRFCKRNYVSFFGGYVNAEDLQQVSATTINSFNVLDGWGMGGSIGRQFHPLFRGEMEFTYRNNVIDAFQVDTLDASGNVIASAITAAVGDVDTFSWMNNFIIDFPPRKTGAMNAYAGGGIGILYADGDIVSGGTTYRIADSSFAFQFIGGINLPIRERVDLFTEYRFLGANNIKVNDITTPANLGDFEFTTHNLFFGIRVYGR